MRLIIPFLILVLFKSSYATWSSFAHVTPETEKEYKIKVELLIDSTDTSRFLVKIKAPRKSHSKKVWLVVSDKKIEKENQKFRDFFWFGKHSKDIVIWSMLKPIEKNPHVYTAEQRAVKQEKFEIIIKKKLLTTTYIYIDFPSVTYDGGYFYSIDLATYLNKEKE